MEIQEDPQSQGTAAAKKATNPDLRTLNGDSSRDDSELGSRNTQANNNVDVNDKAGSKNINTSSQIDDSAQFALKKTISTD